MELKAASPLTASDGPLAHQAEHLPFKQVVPGSSPGRLTPTQRPSGIHASTCTRPHRLAWSRTSPFHGGNGGSNPPGDAWNLNDLRRKGRWRSCTGVYIVSIRALWNAMFGIASIAMAECWACQIASTRLLMGYRSCWMRRTGRTISCGAIRPS